MKDNDFNRIIKIISDKKISDSIILFGSSVNSKKPKDIDLMLYKKNKKWIPKDFIALIKLFEEIEFKFREYGISFSSGETRKKKAKYTLDIAPLDFGDIEELEIFFYGIRLNKNYNILNGKDPFKIIKKPSEAKFKRFLIEEYEYLTKNKDYYGSLKTILRIALLYRGLEVPKEKLIKVFEKEYQSKVDENLKKLLSNKEQIDKETILSLNRLYRFINDFWKVKPSNKKQSKKYKVIINFYKKLRKDWEENKDSKEIIKTIKSYQKKYNKPN